jgi:hypothetical protein
MQPILPNRPQNIEFQERVPNPESNYGYYATISRIVTAVAGFFRAIGLWFVEATSWLKDRVIDLFSISEAAALFTPEMNVFDRFLIIQKVIAIPAEERDSVITNAVRLVTPQMAAGVRGYIIGKVITIAVEEREAVITNVLRLVTPQMVAGDRGYIIGVILKIPAEERDAVVTNVLRLVTPQMVADDRGYIIGVILKIPAEERDAVVTNTLRLVTPQMNAGDRIHIIRKVIAIPVEQREAVITNALRLVTPQMNADGRGIIIRGIIAIPAEEREATITNTLRLITPQMNAYDRIMILLNGLTINVHEGKRDQQVRAAIELLRIHQGQLSEDEINQAEQEFTEYLNNRQMDAEDKRLAKRALSAPKEENEEFGPLISEEPFTILGLEISGKELIGRLWIFASGLTEPDQTNAKDSMISALKDSYYMGSRVCDQGKTQRSVVGVLQGRLEGVDIELGTEMHVPTPLAVAMFFHVEAHRNIEQLEPLLNAANRFCDDNPAVNRDDFIRKIRLYAQVEGFED